MQKTLFTYVPTPDVAGQPLTARSTRAPVNFPVRYDVAELREDAYQYRHKIRLLNRGTVLQFIKQSVPGGEFDLADPADAFSIEDRPLTLELVDLMRDGAKYQLTVTDTPPADPTSRIVLPVDQNPEVRFVEVQYERPTPFGDHVERQLNFIGTIDIRPGLHNRLVMVPGQPVSIVCRNGQVIFEF